MYSIDLTIKSLNQIHSMFHSVSCMRLLLLHVSYQVKLQWDRSYIAIAQVGHIETFVQASAA